VSVGVVLRYPFGEFYICFLTGNARGLSMSEYQEQREVIRWFREKYPAYIKCTRLSLSGVNLPAGKKAAIMINQFKSQGMVKGEADVLFCVPNANYSGLFVEMKAEGGRATQDQEDYIVVMRVLGYAACVIEGAEAAKKMIAAYMETAHSIH